MFQIQVPRASASAVAFGLGLLSGKGKLGQGKNRAFSVLSESRASDICLRFFDSCETYKVIFMVALAFLGRIRKKNIGWCANVTCFFYSSTYRGLIYFFLKF
jgi:hypothetical protein